MVASGRLGLRVCDRCGTEDETVVTRWLAFGAPQLKQADLCGQDWQELQALVAPFLSVFRVMPREVHNARLRLMMLAQRDYPGCDPGSSPG